MVYYLKKHVYTHTQHDGREYYQGKSKLKCTLFCTYRQTNAHKGKYKINYYY